jgi:hypothetical protein
MRLTENVLLTRDQMHEEFRLYVQKLWECVKDRPELWEQTFPMVDFGPLTDEAETPTAPTSGNT